MRPSSDVLHQLDRLMTAPSITVLLSNVGSILQIGKFRILSPCGHGQLLSRSAYVACHPER